MARLSRSWIEGGPCKMWRGARWLRPVMHCCTVSMPGPVIWGSLAARCAHVAWDMKEPWNSGQSCDKALSNGYKRVSVKYGYKGCSGGRMNAQYGQSKSTHTLL